MQISNSVTTSEYEIKCLLNKFLIGNVISVEVSEPMFDIEKVIIEYKDHNDLNKDLKYLKLIELDYTEIEHNIFIEIENSPEGKIKLISSMLSYFSEVLKEIGLFGIDGVEGDGYGSIIIFGNTICIDDDAIKNMNKEQIIESLSEFRKN